MTTGRAVQVLTGASALIAVLVTVMTISTLQRAGVGGLAGAVSVLVVGAIALAIAWAPRAVRLEDDALVVERLAWPSLRIPLVDVLSVAKGPSLEALKGDIIRVAGNGGVMGFTGLFHVRGIGLVRCWATRLGTPTVLLRRRAGKPVLLGVDDAPALLEALRRRVRSDDSRSP